MRTRIASVGAVVGVAALLSASTVGGRTVITAPANKYTPAQDENKYTPAQHDLELGRKAAAVESGGVAAPSSIYTVYTEGGVFKVSVPSNWRELPGSNTVTFAPDRAYGEAGGQSFLTHGIEIGVTRNGAHDLRSATDKLLASRARGNPNLSQPSGYDRAEIDGRQGLHTVISNMSDATGQQERIALFTMLLDDGGLFYMLGVAPHDGFSTYEATFRRVVASIRIIH